MNIEIKLNELFDLYSNLISSINGKGSIYHASHEFSNVHNIIESSLQKIFENFDLNNVCRLNTSHNYFDIYEIKIRGWVSDPETLTPFLYIEGEIDPREDFKIQNTINNR